jgi:GntR family transcriptional regulator / MocR family aminotransferase
VQIEEQLRQAIRNGSLRPQARVPSTRDLARQLGVSRRVVVDAYAQLAAEGYLTLRQGARPRVCTTTARAASPAAAPALAPAAPLYDFRPSVPDLTLFPRNAWLRSLREALRSMSTAELGYSDPRGVPQLRAALADHLGRTRGVVADPARIIITNGYLQGFGLICRALSSGGAKRIAVEDPSNPEDRVVAARAGLSPVPIAVDAKGMRVDRLPSVDVDAVALTPAHQNPTGVVLAGPRRTALLGWLRENSAIAVEDDYDAEYRYDRVAVGALQSLDPERVIYAGSASKTLAPALRLGWLVVPSSMLAAVCDEKLHADRGSTAIEQHALADFLARGELDRHTRRMRTHYRRRRDALVKALSNALPEAKVSGIAAGLHVTVTMPERYDEGTIRERARHQRIEIETMSDFGVQVEGRAPALVLGYAQMPESTIEAGINELARVVRAVAPKRPPR